MGNDFKESVRQAFVVMKNEIKKYFSGKRMLVFLVLLAIIVFVIVAAPYMFGSETDPVYFIMMSSLVVLMASTLFASISIVSEYEERTALIVFTRPIRKTSIFAGKAMACIVLTIAFTALYYVIAMLVSLFVEGSVSGDLLVSFGLACAYAFGTIGIAMFVSSIMKKGSTSTIITFVILAVIITALSMVLNAANVNSSWMIDQAANSIMECSEEYRNMMNEMYASLAQMLSDPSTFVNFDTYQTAFTILYPGSGVTKDILITAILAPVGPDGSMAFDFSAVSSEILNLEVKVPDYLRDTLVMIAWGAVAMVAAFFAFIRREF